MKSKKLVSKIGAIALCAVMAVGSVVSTNAAVVDDDSDVGYTPTSTGKGKTAITHMETTGQTVLCKKGYVFPNSNVKVDKEFTMPQIKLGKGEIFRYYLYDYAVTDAGGDEYYPIAFKSVKSDWKGQNAAGNLTTGFSNKYFHGGKMAEEYNRYTVSVKGNNKCTYNLIAYDLIYDYQKKYSNIENHWSMNTTKASDLNRRYPLVAVSVYNAPSSVTLKRSDNKSSISGKTITLKKGQTLSVYECTPSGSYANAKNITYTSTNGSIASVKKNSTFSGTAKIKAVNKGTATITVKLYNGKTASVKIKVQ